MAKRDYYEILGVSRTASAAEIKKSYRRLAMKHHPDRNSEDADASRRFREVREAYDVLNDPDKRAAYDQFGHAGVRGRAGPGGPGVHERGVRLAEGGDRRQPPRDGRRGRGEGTGVYYNDDKPASMIKQIESRVCRKLTMN